MSATEIRARLEAIEVELRAIHTSAGAAELSADQTTEWDKLETEAAEARTNLVTAEETEARAARVTESRKRFGAGVNVSVTPVDDNFEVLRNGGYGVSRQALIDANMRAVETRMDDRDKPEFKRILTRHSSDTRWIAGILGRSRPEYETAWAKMMQGRPELLTNEERAAIAVGTNTQGGYLVPTHLDPTLILTNNGSSNIIRGLSRVVSLTDANVWNGVTTAGVTASWDAELAEVSDDSPTFAAVAIPVHKASSLVAASIEAFEDISGMASDVAMLFADARDRLEGAAHALGSGSGQPTGVFTAVNAVSGSKITSTTAATIGLVDLHALYKGVPVRHRSRSSWVMNPLYSTAIKALGTAISASYSGDLRDPIAGRIMGLNAYDSDDAPTTQTTTALDLEVLLGDFSSYVIVDKPGSTSVEFIPHLFNTSNNLPDGRRAWYMHFRSGADATDPNAFRLLVDKTSA